jgi:hypothetical protein
MRGHRTSQPAQTKQSAWNENDTSQPESAADGQPVALSEFLPPPEMLIFGTRHAADARLILYVRVP